MIFNKLENKPKLIKHNRTVSEGDRGKHIPVGECFAQLQIRKKIFRDRVTFIENLTRDYILGQVLHRANQFGTGYSTNGRHYISLNREMLTQSCSQIVTNPILKTKAEIKLLSPSISVIEVRTPEIPDSNKIYELDFNIFQLPEGIILLDVMHCVDQKYQECWKFLF